MDAHLATEIRARWTQLVLPPGSFGRLENLVVHYGLIRGKVVPSISRKGMYIFCADHGVAAEGVSLWPQDVTRTMVRTFVRGGAVINAMCRQFGIELAVVDMGVRGPAETGVVDCKIAEGTADFTRAEAMTAEQVNQALETGIVLAHEAATRLDVVGIGDMGVASTTSASAIISAVTGRDANETVGDGAGTNESSRNRKMLAVRVGINRHREHLVSPFGVLRCLGGFEIAAMTGFLLGAASVRLPVVVDGFIAGAAALLARAFAADVLDTAIFAHRSPERAHPFLLDFLHVAPQFDLDMRLGQGAGAAIGINLLETALRAYRETATLDEAQITRH